MEKNQARALKLFVVLNRANKVIAEEAHKLVDPHGLNPTEFGVLELLYHRGPQPIQKIGQKILLRSGSMTYVVNKLEERGYLARVTCTKDKRITHISITEKGTELIEDIFPAHMKNIESLMSGLNEEEQELAIHLIRKLGVSVNDLSK